MGRGQAVMLPAMGGRPSVFFCDWQLSKKGHLEHQKEATFIYPDKKKNACRGIHHKI